MTPRSRLRTGARDVQIVVSGADGEIRRIEVLQTPFLARPGWMLRYLPVDRWRTPTQCGSCVVPGP